tara:strand:- start:22 stop:159 length:138 start_codon:yes stop_codon:yes gene_type:complete
MTEERVRVCATRVHHLFVGRTAKHEVNLARSHRDGHVFRLLWRQK